MSKILIEVIPIGSKTYTAKRVNCSGETNDYIEDIHEPANNRDLNYIPSKESDKLGSLINKSQDITALNSTLTESTAAEAPVAPVAPETPETPVAPVAPETAETIDYIEDIDEPANLKSEESVTAADNATNPSGENIEGMDTALPKSREEASKLSKNPIVAVQESTGEEVANKDRTYKNIKGEKILEAVKKIEKKEGGKKSRRYNKSNKRRKRKTTKRKQRR